MAYLSDHFNGRLFRNPSGVAPKGLAALLKWQLQNGRKPWPKSVAASDPVPPPQRTGDEIVVTFINHSTFLIQTPSANILTDPIYSERASPVSFAGPKRVRRPGVPFEQLPHVDIVLISHNHYDHMDLPALRRIESKHKPLVITGLGNAKVLSSAGIQKVREIDWWDSIDAGLKITMTPAQHFSARTLWDRNRSLWGGFLIEENGRRIYFAGDTAYTSYFREIRQRYGAPDLALLPIGAYKPRWFMKDVHVNPAEAVQAHIDLQARASIGMHFGTFSLADEGIDEPIHDLHQALAERHVSKDSFQTLDFGGSYVLPGS
jgi:L-ascorbate metabolism protein UlaG (beta-lactamase superfamily)